ncbi:Uncharacterized protein dnl_29410 [Desulfonema limicola]|uniref:Uncharacterized protein n=1 Tax=Desulfonema limicola TaxID=45656 RepID=A0A975B8N6_9BACT|nr:Uncharacterized protein dnl_29410 [Desulfonema limicola]
MDGADKLKKQKGFSEIRKPESVKTERVSGNKKNNPSFKRLRHEIADFIVNT